MADWAGPGARQVAIWVFQDGVFRIYALAADGAYGEQTASRLMPSLDFAVVARYAVRADTPRVLREFEQEIG
jgi:hypothetical protein